MFLGFEDLIFETTEVILKIHSLLFILLFIITVGTAITPIYNLYQTYKHYNISMDYNTIILYHNNTN